MASSSSKFFSLAIISLAVCSRTEARLGGSNPRELVSDHILTEFKPVQPKPDPPGGFGPPSSISSSGNEGRNTGTTTPPPPPPPAPPVESYTISSSELPEQASEGSPAPPADGDLGNVFISGAMEEPPTSSVSDSADDEDAANDEGEQVTGGGSKHDGSFFIGDYPDIAAAFTPINP